MGVDVEWHSRVPDLPDWHASRRTLLGAVTDEDDLLADLIPTLSAESYPVLSAVDPYGDTVLDSGQATIALSEVARLGAEAWSERMFCEELARLLERCTERPGSVVAFVGD
ncbi:hypothetical protein ACFVVL_26735 [Kitasatospora sp. NPDC058115]|uniref:hypothetical protein n=1 Tax=Kitasatospora sp. NPDC058115 TaxID=3346347 RepID=UPI0036DCF666